MFELGMGVFWLLVLAVMIVFELFSLGLTTIWFGGGALCAAVASILGANVIVQIIIFAVVSILLMVLMRPFALKFINNNRTKTNIESVVGEEVKVTKKIDNFNEEGEVFLNGLDWMARSDSDQIIEAGEKVIVKEVSGVKLIVTNQKTGGN